MIMTLSLAILTSLVVRKSLPGKFREQSSTRSQLRSCTFDSLKKSRRACARGACAPVSGQDLSEGPVLEYHCVTGISLQLGFFLISAERIEGKQALATDSTLCPTAKVP
jgi:hypothetical protein